MIANAFTPLLFLGILDLAFILFMAGASFAQTTFMLIAVDDIIALIVLPRLCSGIT
jgi:hypothetical protein